VRGRSYLLLSVGIWAPLGVGVILGVQSLAGVVELGLVAVLLAVGMILWTIPTIVYFGQRSNESLLEALGRPPETPARPPQPQRASAAGVTRADATALAIPPAQETRDLLRLERFLLEARFPNEASERNAKTWLGYLHVTYPFLTAKLPPSAGAELEAIKREVGAEPLSRIRAEVQEYMAMHQLEFPEVRGEASSHETAGPSSLPDLSDSGLPRVVLRTTRELRDLSGGILRAGTEGLFVWFPTTPRSGEELVAVRIGNSTKTLPLDSVIAVSPSGHAEVWNKNRESILGLGREGPTARSVDVPPVKSAPANPSPEPSSAPEREQSVRSTEREPRPTEIELFDETLEVEATGHAEIHMPMKKGTRLMGFAQETSGLPFDFYVMDRKNYVRFCEDRGGSEIFAETDRVALDFRKTIPRDGVWYFVFDTYNKQANRKIRFELRADEPS
jgi:hypothetical protein